jgi:tRNA threonylcarbamoyladenosine biosynthesis protein TsaB
MVRELAADAEIAFAAFDRIAVTVGPGSFTGLRVGLAFAKGLSVALGRTCVGVGTLEALATSVGAFGLVACVIDAGRGNVYVQVFEGGRPLAAPEIVPRYEAAWRLARYQNGTDLTIVGPGANLFEDMLQPVAHIDLAAPSPEAVARLGLRSPARPARPLYLRPPDAERSG